MWFFNNIFRFLLTNILIFSNMFFCFLLKFSFLGIYNNFQIKTKYCDYASTTWKSVECQHKNLPERYYPNSWLQRRYISDNLPSGTNAPPLYVLERIMSVWCLRSRSSQLSAMERICYIGFPSYTVDSLHSCDKEYDLMHHIDVLWKLNKWNEMSRKWVTKCHENV